MPGFSKLLHSLTLIAAVLCCGCGRTDTRVADAMANGLRDQEAGHHTTAIKSFTQAMIIDPKDREPVFYRAVSYAAVKNYSAAISDLERVTKLSPKWEKPWWYRGVLAREAGQNSQAIKYFTRALELNPQLSAALFDRAQLSYKMNRKKQALTDLTRLVECRDATPKHRRRLAQVQFELAEYSKSLRNYSQLLRDSPDDASLWLDRCNVHDAHGQQEFALLDLDQAIRRLPFDQKLIYRRIALLRHLGRNREVVDELTRIAGRNRDDLEVRREIVELGQRTGQDKAVIEAATDLLRGDSENVDLYQTRAMAHYRRGNAYNALSDLDTAITFEPGNMELQLARLRLYLEDDDFVSVLHRADDLVRTHPLESELWCFRALAEKGLGHNAAARRHLTKAIALAPTNSRYRRLLREVEQVLPPDVVVTQQNSATTPRRESATSPRGKRLTKAQRFSRMLDEVVADRHARRGGDSSELMNPQAGEPAGAPEVIAGTDAAVRKSATTGPPERVPVETLPESVAASGKPLSDADQEEPAEQVLVASGNRSDVRRLLSDSDFQEAVTLCDELIRNAPGDAELYLLRARANSGLERFEAALADLRIAEARRPRDVMISQQLAEVCLRLQKPQAAVNRLSVVIEKQPASTAARVMRGRAFAMLDRPDEARADLDFAVAQEPENIDARRYRARVAASMKAHGLVIEDATAALDLGSQDTQLRYLRAVAWAATEKPAEAVRDLDVYLRANPNDQHALAQRAHAHSALSNFEQAAADWTLVLQLDPDFPEARLRHGMASFGLGRYQDAADDFTAAIEVGEDSASVRFKRALALRRLNRSKDALTDLNLAIERDPSLLSAYEHRAMILAADQRAEDAIDDLTAVVLRDPQRSNAFYNRAVLYEGIGRHRMAISDYSKMIKLRPSATGYLRRGLAYRTLKESKAAVDDFSAAIDLDPKMFRAHYHRGVLAQQAGRLEDALADYDTAVRLSGDFAEAIYQRGTVYYSMNRMDDALADWRRTVEMKPDFGPAWNNIGAIHASRKQDEQASTCYARAVKASPNFAKAWDNLAWILATSKQATVRDPAAAVQAAARACELTDSTNWSYLHTSAVANAEAGNMPAAAQDAALAASLAPVAERQRIVELANLYKAGQRQRH